MKTYPKLGFSLAEILITMGIIGVIAAITIPALVKNYQKYITVNRLKKEYSVISNAFVTSQDENGDMNTWGMNAMGSVEDGVEVLVPFFQNYILKYLDIIDDCGYDCKKQTKIKRYRLNGMDWSWDNFAYYIIYMKDGSVVAFSVDNDAHVWGLVRIYIDINGDRGPNVSGKDIFTIFLNPDGDSAIRLSGSDVLNSSKNRNSLFGNCRECCSKTAGDYSGDFCGALIQHDGWKILKDYPW